VPTRLVSRLLFRAPLLPVAESPDLLAHPLGEAALLLASPDLSEAIGKGESPPALRRYSRRAAFRPTPSGLLAGVGVATLGARTKIDTGEPEPRLQPSWRWLARRARELLEDDVMRARARVRRAPSLLVDGDSMLWLKDGRALMAEVDDRIAAILERCVDWTPLASAGDPELLLQLVDDGVLAHDLEPPLVGRAPLGWLLEKVAGTPWEGRLQVESTDLGAGDVQATLLHLPEKTPTVARATVERAAALAGLLFRLADALAPPSAERALDPALGDALDALSETFGPGAFALAPLALGAFGTPLSFGEEPPPPEAGSVPAPLLRALASTRPVELDVRELDEVLPPADAPPSFELFLTPASGSTPWLLGVHAPAGATAGRYAHADPEVAEALDELALLEPEGTVDVAWAPEPALADLCAHPPARRATLAITSWPDGPALAVCDLALVADERADEPLLLAGPTGPVRPSPLHRVRSTALAPGVYRLLAGWSLRRQHTPWAMPLGPLATLPFVPRLLVDGFVISPATWLLPALADRAALTAFRRRAKLPRHVQVGREDELLLVDLDDPTALDDLAGHDRVWEVWPPLDRLVDRAGRRVELVAFAVDDAPPPAAVAVGPVPPPRVTPPPEGWRTFKLFGAPDRQDRVLHGVVAPVIAAARAAGELSTWSFLRYVDAPGRRDHLRVRVRGNPAAVEARLHAALAPARAAGDVVIVESADYVRELGRYREHIAVVERMAEIDSDLVLALLEAEHDENTVPAELLTRVFDATTAALGLDLAARQELARRRRDAHGGELDDEETAKDFRRRHARLRALLSRAHVDDTTRALDEHAGRLRGLEVPPALLPELLHLAAVRLAGPHRELEALAYVYWQRTLEGLITRKPSPPGSRPP
jgi:thiopeptide-type bacteriocin biosynthesis protein